MSTKITRVSLIGYSVANIPANLARGKEKITFNAIEVH